MFVGRENELDFFNVFMIKVALRIWLYMEILA